MGPGTALTSSLTATVLVGFVTPNDERILLVVRTGPLCAFKLSTTSAECGVLTAYNIFS